MFRVVKFLSQHASNIWITIVSSTTDALKSHCSGSVFYDMRFIVSNTIWFGWWCSSYDRRLFIDISAQRSSDSPWWFSHQTTGGGFPQCRIAPYPKGLSRRFGIDYSLRQCCRVCPDVMLSQPDVLGAAKLTQQEKIPGRSSHDGLCTNATACRSACFCGLVFLLAVFDVFHGYSFG